MTSATLARREKVFRVIDPRHLGVLGEIVYHLEGVVDVTLNAEGQRLKALEQDEGVEGRDGCTSIAEQDSADAGDESCRSGDIGEHGTVVRGVGLGECRVLIGVLLPIEGAAVDNYAAEA